MTMIYHHEVSNVSLIAMPHLIRFFLHHTYAISQSITGILKVFQPFF